MILLFQKNLALKKTQRTDGRRRHTDPRLRVKQQIVGITSDVDAIGIDFEKPAGLLGA